MPLGTVAVAVACSTACGGGPVDCSQICVPGAIGAPLLIGFVAAASENMRAPVAVTVTVSSTVELIVNGPTVEPAGPFALVGLMVRLGDGGSMIGPAASTAATIAATASCRGSDVLSTYRSLKNQMAAWTAAAFCLGSVRVTGWSVLGKKSFRTRATKPTLGTLAAFQVPSWYPKPM